MIETTTQRKYCTTTLTMMTSENSPEIAEHWYKNPKNDIRPHCHRTIPPFAQKNFIENVNDDNDYHRKTEKYYIVEIRVLVFMFFFQLLFVLCSSLFFYKQFSLLQLLPQHRMVPILKFLLLKQPLYFFIFIPFSSHSIAI